jgi:REP-associated tyrosine transposase
LARLDRIYVCHPIYFVTASTADRKRILAHPRIHAALVTFAQEGRAHGAWIGRYVLLPDYCHLFVACDHERISLSTWAKSFKNAISAELRHMGIESPHWQKGFFDHLLRSEESAAEKWEYVRDNPVRAGLVVDVNDWKFAGEISPLEYR